MADQLTPRTTLAAHHNVTAWCPHCGHVSGLDFARADRCRAWRYAIA
jgi:predicted RNA-binding Zn-ribbon protein involved in translation (DUF1610 family)